MVQPADIRVALFSGNYNYVRDGANQSLNRLVGYLLRQGVKVRVYSPTTDTPAFAPTGDLVTLPSFAIPGRAEYRVPYTLSRAVRRDLADFAPNVLHISSPDPASHRAVSWARRRGIPAIATIHTRFDTYLQYYHLQFLEPAMRAGLRRLYRRCDAILAPSESMAAVLRAQRMNPHIGIWSRGVDRAQFHEGRRDPAWRRAHGFADDEMVVLFLGRLVLEKGLATFADAIDAARARGVPLKLLVVGDGPARDTFAERLGDDAVFAGMLTGEALARAVASSDVFLNPSITETFGNVSLEAMSSGLPVIAASATGATTLIRDRVNGRIVDPTEIDDYAEALADYAADPAMRAAHGAAGIADAKTRDWDEINRAVLRTYTHVIDRRRAARR